MLKRTLTALFLIPPVLYLIGWSPRWLFVLAVAAAVVLALREYFALCRAMEIKVFPWIGYAAGVVLCVALEGDIYRIIATPLLLTLALLIPTITMWRSRDLKDYLAATSATFFGVLYIGLTLSCLVSIRFSADSLGYHWLQEGAAERSQVLNNGSHLVLLLFVVIWAGDICAYLVGRPFGRTPFFARISPRKTWEGAFAGLAGSIFAAWVFTHWFFKTAYDEKTVLLIAAWIAVAGQIGDLVESAIKRGANQKDSGTLLPGHGGFLDRIDSLLFGAPALWLALVFLGTGCC